MSGVLNFQNFVGGPDQVQCESIFPSTQKTLVYNFARDITGWTFEVDHQTLVVDSVKFNRNSGQPNFSDSTVVGSFPKQEVTGDFAPEVINTEVGTVKVHFPANMYTGAIVPDARVNVPITVLSVTWRDNSTPAQVNTHRWALVMCYEPDVPVGDPTLDPSFIPLVIGS